MIHILANQTSILLDQLFGLLGPHKSVVALMELAKFHGIRKPVDGITMFVALHQPQEQSQIWKRFLRLQPFLHQQEQLKSLTGYLRTLHLAMEPHNVMILLVLILDLYQLMIQIAATGILISGILLSLSRNLAVVMTHWDLALQSAFSKSFIMLARISIVWLVRSNRIYAMGSILLILRLVIHALSDHLQTLWEMTLINITLDHFIHCFWGMLIRTHIQLLKAGPIYKIGAMDTIHKYEIF